MRADLPEVIIHNSVSLNNSLTNFDVNLGLHYELAKKFKPDAHLIGSNTIKEGAKNYPISKESKNDFFKPKRSKDLPYWVIVDTKGVLKGLLHTCRSFELCKDVIVLVSKKTPIKYIDYLKERDYDYHFLGDDHVDLKKALIFLKKKYKINKVMTDTGAILSNLLINQGLANKLSLLVHPVLAKKVYNIFSFINKDFKLKLIKKDLFEKNYLHLIYSLDK